MRLALIITLFIAGCGTSGRVSVMHDFGKDPDTLGQNPVCVLDIQKPINSMVYAKYTHQSWCFTGKPFNDNPESTIDAVGVELKLW
jgi:hypothetical protein